MPLDDDEIIEIRGDEDNQDDSKYDEICEDILDNIFGSESLLSREQWEKLIVKN